MARLISQQLGHQQKILESPKAARTKTNNPAHGCLKKNAAGVDSQATTGDMEQDTDEGDDDDHSGTTEGREADTGEADALALSDTAEGLAGLPLDDLTTFGDDELHAVTGADADGSDDDYDGVGNISDEEGSGTEEDETDVLLAAEGDLIQEFERTEQRRSTSLLTAGISDMALPNDDSFEALFPSATRSGRNPGAAWDMNDDPFVGLASHDSLYQEMWNDAEDALAVWRMPSHAPTRERSAESTTNKKRVRFEETTRSANSSVTETSDEGADDDPDEAFPDLFTSQDDPILRRHFAIDADIDAGFPHDYSDVESFYDFDGDEEGLALAINEESDSDEVMSDYDSDDDGDTTDEETPEEQLARMRAIQKATGKTATVAPSTPLASKARPTHARSHSAAQPCTPKSGRGPRVGTFVLDPTRASMSADAFTRRIKLFPPSKPPVKDKAFWQRAKTAFGDGTRPVSSPGVEGWNSFNDQIPDRPFTAQSTLGSMFNGNLDILRNNDVSGIGAELFPQATPTAHSSFSSTALVGHIEPEVEELDMHDFIALPDNDDSQLTPTPSAPDDHLHFSHPASRNDSGCAGLLDHLDQQRGLVGSFRRNQTQARHVSSLASHPAKRASTLETNALQKGRRGAANTPMTPARKKRGSEDFTLTGAGVRKAVASPSATRRPRSRAASLSGAGAGIHQTLSPAIM